MKTYNYTLKTLELEKQIDFSLIKNEKNILIQIFCGNKKQILEKIIKNLTKNLPQAICLGSSTDGGINGEKITTRKTIISISIFEKTTLKALFVKNKNSFPQPIFLKYKYLLHSQQHFFLTLKIFFVKKTDSTIHTIHIQSITSFY